MKEILSVVGNQWTAAYHRAASVAEDLAAEHVGKLELSLTPMTEVDWAAYRQEKIKEFGGEAWGLQEEVVVFSGKTFLGDAAAFVATATAKFGYHELRSMAIYEALAVAAKQKYWETSAHDFVFFDVEIGEEAAGRLVFELYSDVCPKTCANFKALCTGEKGINERDHKLSYASSIFHRVQSDSWIQGGDIVNGSGACGDSIYGEVFADENFIISHTKRGVLSMANKGIHSNSSQFFIGVRPMPFFDRKFVAFGQLIEGSQCLDRLQTVSTYNGRPETPCKIVACGVHCLKSPVTRPGAL